MHKQSKTIKSSNYPVDVRIVEIMEKAGLKQCAVAKKAGYTNHEFNDMVRGRRLIKIADAINLASVLGVTPNDLFALLESGQC